MRRTHLRAFPILGIWLLFAGATATSVGAVPRRPGSARRAPIARSEPLIVLSGMPGSGKSTLAEVIAGRLGTRHVATGDEIRRIVHERGLADTPENSTAVAEELSRKTPGALSRALAERIRLEHGPRPVVEGPRSPVDLKIFREILPETVHIALVTDRDQRRDRKIRYARLLKRGRPGETSRRVLRARDASERKRGIRELMRRADLTIVVPDGADLEATAADVIRAAREILARRRAVAPR